MRKFRVWDTETKGYSSLWFLVSCDGDLCVWDDDGMRIVASGRYIVEFATDRMDINGVLIYCGDYIEYRGYEYEVVWEDSGFHLDQIDGDLSWDLHGIISMKIGGNVNAYRT